jgi:hypothetical protein
MESETNMKLLQFAWSMEKNCIHKVKMEKVSFHLDLVYAIVYAILFQQYSLDYWTRSDRKSSNLGPELGYTVDC